MTSYPLERYLSPLPHVHLLPPCLDIKYIFFFKISMCVCVCVCVCVVRSNVFLVIHNSGVGRCQKVGGAQRHVIYLPSVKNQYKRVVFGYMVIYEQPSVSVY